MKVMRVKYPIRTPYPTLTNSTTPMAKSTINPNENHIDKENVINLKKSMIIDNLYKEYHLTTTIACSIEGVGKHLNIETKIENDIISSRFAVYKTICESEECNLIYQTNVLDNAIMYYNAFDEFKNILNTI